MDITINEWFFHYLASEDEKEYTLADNIFSRMFERCDRMVLLKGSPMNEKINLLSKINFPKQRNIIKNFFRRFGYNLEKVLLMEEINELPEEIINSLPKKEKDKDKYLVQTCLNTTDKIIVTTDNNLKKAVDGKCGIKVKLLEEFWKDYKNA